MSLTLHVVQVCRAQHLSLCLVSGHLLLWATQAAQGTAWAQPLPQVIAGRWAPGPALLSGDSGGPGPGTRGAEEATGSLGWQGTRVEIDQDRGFLGLQLGAGSGVPPWALDKGSSWLEKKAHLYLTAHTMLVSLPPDPHLPLHSDTLSPGGLSLLASDSLPLANHADKQGYPPPCASSAPLLSSLGQRWTHSPGSGSSLGSPPSWAAGQYLTERWGLLSE